ncbi:MAG TPA: DUF5329 domain-containing protein [Thiobacillaceae bacterium]|nr:DUF5329 domain-containing protein [Thiobacillaceae bacterium]
MIARLFPALFLSCLFAPAVTAATPSPARGEIDALLARLQFSTCEFNRNGSWHNAAEAKAHLLVKLNYLEARTTIQSTEQFIEMAASRSSMSGQPYLVKCPNAVPVESGPWLLRQLQAIRSAGAMFAPSPH